MAERPSPAAHHAEHRRHEGTSERRNSAERTLNHLPFHPSIYHEQYTISRPATPPWVYTNMHCNRYNVCIACCATAINQVLTTGA